jgi:hypothetical protein
MDLPNPSRPYRLKATLISHDGGRTWIITRQYYLVDLAADQFLNIELQGQALVFLKRESDDVR